jgi:ribosomal protein S21
VALAGQRSRKGRKFVARVKRLASCSCCGYDKCPDALEFHHVNPKPDDKSIGVLRDSAIKRIKEEMRKCVILCANCHREVHYNEPSLKKNFNNKKENKWRTDPLRQKSL